MAGSNEERNFFEAFNIYFRESTGFLSRDPTTPGTFSFLQPSELDDGFKLSRVSKYWMYEAEIKKKAAEGFKYAKLLEKSMGHFKSGFVALERLMASSGRRVLNNNEIEELKAKTLMQIGLCYKTTELVATLEVRSRQYLHDIAFQTLKKLPENENSQLKLHSLICYSFHVFLSHPESAIAVLDDGIRKYPEELVFHTLKCDVFGFMNKFDEGIKWAENSLKIFPDNYELLFIRAAMMKHLQREEMMPGSGKNKLKPESVVAAHLEFLKHCPQDHRHKPDIFYSLAEVLIMKNRMLFEKDRSAITALCPQLRKYYQFGLRAEKYLLPCFLPYELSNSKTVVEFHLRVFDTNPLESNYIHISPLAKMEKIREYRQFIQNDLSLSFSKLDVSSNDVAEKIKSEDKNIEPKIKVKDGKSSSTGVDTELSQMEPIELWDMDKNETHTYDGRFIKLTIIEDTVFNNQEYVDTIVEDCSGGVERCFIYGLDQHQQDSSLQHYLGYGCIITVMNPCMHLGSDRKASIRVADPSSSIVYHLLEKDDHRCRFCGKAGAVQKCSNCKRMYCNKDCQVQDWKVLKHKLICNKSIN